MYEFIVWILLGALSGWIGYLYARNDEGSRLRAFVAVGVIGGVLGGVLTRALAATDTAYWVNPDNAFSALIASGLFVAIYTVVLTSLGNTSQDS